MSTIGIKETKELLEFGFALQKGIVASLEDKKISLTDFPNFMPAIVKSTSAFGGIQQVKAEMLDLSDEEKKELIEFARDKFDLDDDDLEKLIEDTLVVLIDLFEIALRYIDRTQNG